MSSYLRQFRTLLGRNETARSLFLIGIIILAVVGTWGGLRLALSTPYPVLVVVSPSMVPTLQVGDLIVIRGQDPSTIKAGSAPVGSIIVFRPPCCSPGLNDPNYLVVHRVIGLHPGNQNFDTRGDNNGGNNDPWDSIGVPPSNIVGVYQTTVPVPYLGSSILAVRSFMYDDQTGQPRPQGIAVIVTLIILLLALETLWPSSKKKEGSPPESASQSPAGQLGEPEPQTRNPT